MPNSIDVLLTRNLHDVFGENDPERRRSAIEEIFAEDCVFYAPDGVYRGKEAIHAVAGAIRAIHSDHAYTVLRPTEELHGDAGRIVWVGGPAGQDPAYAGTDIIVARDGLITEVYLFFDALPA